METRALTKRVLIAVACVAVTAPLLRAGRWISTNVDFLEDFLANDNAGSQNLAAVGNGAGGYANCISDAHYGCFDLHASSAAAAGHETLIYPSAGAPAHQEVVNNLAIQTGHAFRAAFTTPSNISDAAISGGWRDQAGSGSVFSSTTLALQTTTGPEGVFFVYSPTSQTCASGTFNTAQWNLVVKKNSVGLHCAASGLSVAASTAYDLVLRREVATDGSVAYILARIEPPGGRPTLASLASNAPTVEGTPFLGIRISGTTNRTLNVDLVGWFTPLGARR